MSALEVVPSAAPRSRRRGIPRVSLGYVGIAVILIITVVAIFAPLISPQDPNAINLLAAKQGPSSAHLLGTDASGRDLLSRLIWGARTSLLGPLLVVVGGTLLGVTVALVAAWRGGIVDAILGRCIDIGFAFPGLLLAIIASAFFGAGLVAPTIGLAIAYTPYIARLTRSVAIRERRLPYISALVTQGMSSFAICIKHLLPNLAPFILMQATLTFGFSMIDLASVSFLGLGVQPPTSDWGLMVSTGEQSLLQGSAWESLFAGLMLVITVGAFSTVGHWLEGISERRLSR